MTNRNELPKVICFDMDGTIADLYAVNDWLLKLRSEDPTPYAKAAPMWDMAELAEVLKALILLGIEIRVITWLSKESSEDFKTATRQAKRDWLDQYSFPYNHFHGIQYGATKADSVRKTLGENETAWLIDDNKKVRDGWHLGEAIDPTKVNIIDLLRSLL